MSQRGSQRGGAAAAEGRGSQGSTSADCEVRIGLNDLIMGNGPGAPQYGRFFSQAASFCFYTQKAEHERAMELSNNAQSISRLVLSVAQLLRQSIRSCLSRTYYDGTELQEEDLREALAKHAECWTSDSIDPSIAAADVCRRVTMESEATAVDRIDAVHSRLEQYLENPSAERVFRDTLRAYRRDPAAVISKALVAGLQPPEFKLKVEHQLEMRGAWKDKPREVFDLVREVAVERRTVEMADKQRNQTRTGRVNLRGQSSTKPFPGVSAGGAVDKASTAVVTCFKCRKPGHLARNCPLHTFHSKVSSPPAGGRGNGGHGSSTGRGRPPPPAQQQQLQQQRQQQQRQPQHPPQQQQRFSAHQPGSTSSSTTGGRGADWGTVSKTALETPFVDVLVHMLYEKHAIAHALTRSRTYICRVIPIPNRRQFSLMSLAPRTRSRQYLGHFLCYL